MISRSDLVIRHPRWWSALTTGLAISALIGPLAVIFARWHRSADAFTHFSLMGALLTLGCLVLAGCRRKPIAAAWAALLILQLAPFAQLIFQPPPTQPDPGQSDRLRILSVNVYLHNEDFARVTTLITDNAPDVVGLIEYTPLWAEALRPVAANYPYRYEFPHESGAMGIGLWFKKRPLIEPTGRVQPIPGAWPWLNATIEFGGKPLALWLVHPSNPISRTATGPGHPELEALALSVQNADPEAAKLVIGDLNTTDGSPYFRDFLRRTQLWDTRQGLGIQGSWPARSLYRISIDHAFVSKDLAVTHRSVGPYTGSDHLPLRLELAPALRISK